MENEFIVDILAEIRGLLTDVHCKPLNKKLKTKEQIEEFLSEVEDILNNYID